MTTRDSFLRTVRDAVLAGNRPGMAAPIEPRGNVGYQGASGVDYLVAETGSIAILARPEEPRSLSLLPPVHIAVADRSQIIPDLFDLFTRLGATEDMSETPVMPSCVTLITGPSKTGDI